MPNNPEVIVASEIDKAESKFRNSVKWAGKIIASTVLVCITATPFVNMWADKVAENVEPVTGSLDKVGAKTEDLKITVEEGMPKLSDQIGGLRTSVDSLNPNAPVTTTTTTVLANK